MFVWAPASPTEPDPRPSCLPRRDSHSYNIHGKSVDVTATSSVHLLLACFIDGDGRCGVYGRGMESKFSHNLMKAKFTLNFTEAKITLNFTEAMFTSLTCTEVRFTPLK